MTPAKSIGASVALALTFVLSATTGSYAGGITPDVSVDVTVSPIMSGGYDWDYKVTITNPDAGVPIGAIEIPEVKSGYLQPTLPLPTGWKGKEIDSPAFANPHLKTLGAPGAWILLSADAFEDYINASGRNNPLDFNLFSWIGGSTPAQVSTAFLFQGEYEFQVTVDPITPNSVPEPATWALMGLGALGLIALRRRKAPALAHG
jgi:hypothetical protein